ncbi:50S ribosomal protein L22 [Patescibacteria group bacterium]|nr:50S ribosomal protein L22 [Patescibacteria group bacterium]
MEVLAKGKYIKTSPKKARAVADLIRGKSALEAQVILSVMPQTSAAEIRKVLESAIANAENNFNLEKSKLMISKISIDGGPVVKRYMPRAKGMASEIKRRTSHIEIVVSGDVKTKKKAEEKETKIEATKAKEGQATEIDTNKIELERPQDKININKKGQKSGAPKIFRRKTG